VELSWVTAFYARKDAGAAPSWHRGATASGRASRHRLDVPAATVPQPAIIAQVDVPLCALPRSGRVTLHQPAALASRLRKRTGFGYRLPAAFRRTGIEASMPPSRSAG